VICRHKLRADGSGMCRLEKGHGSAHSYTTTLQRLAAYISLIDGLPSIKSMPISGHRVTCKTCPPDAPRGYECMQPFTNQHQQVNGSESQAVPPFALQVKSERMVEP
jgi:hypothetical protein